MRFCSGSKRLIFPILALCIFMISGCSSADAAEAGGLPTPFVYQTPIPIERADMTATIWPPLLDTPAALMITRIPGEIGDSNLPAQIVDAHDVVMLLVPEGEFTMGSEAGYPDEVPVHPVWVDSFYIDRLEVTNRQYQDCVEAGACSPPRRADCCTEDPNRAPLWPTYFGNPEYDNYPVIFITWFDANDFCTWRGARLATEAEWEKASRGDDARIYPWGNEEPMPELLNFTWLPGEFEVRPRYATSPVGSYPKGASPYGVLDLAGNVYEWLWDRYDANYYEVSPYENPTGPDTGDFRLTRGGSFFNQAFRNRSANRNNAYIPASSFHFDGGARCASDPPK